MIDQKQSAIEELSASIKNMGNSITRMKEAMDECRKQGLNPNDIRDEIIKEVPEEERAVFLQQWPMLSMMLAAL